MTAPVDTTVLIQNDTEEQLIGSLLEDGGAITLCQMERLEPRMFGIVRNEWIYAAMLDLHARGDEIDLVTVTNELERRGQLHEVQGDDGYLSKLMVFSGNGLAFRTYAADIRRAFEFRQFVDFARTMATLGLKRGDGKSVTAAYSMLRREFDAIRPYEPNQNFTYGVETFEAYRQMLDDMQTIGAAYEQPWDVLNHVYGSAQPGDMFGIVGPTGSGKSSALSTAAEFHAEILGKRTVYIFTEMRLKKVLDRRMTKYSAIDYRRLKNPVELTEGEKQLMITGESKIMDWAHKLDYWHAPAPTASGLLSTMRRMNTELGTEVFVIDHMNDIDVSEYDAGPKEWEKFFVDLEAFCNDTGAIVWTAAQRNRNDGKAYMIGQAFDNKMCVVMELQPNELQTDFAFSFDGKTYEYYAGQNSPIVPVHFRKVRDGSPSRGKLLFVGPRYLWVDLPSGFDDGSDDPGAYAENGGAR